MQVSGILVVLHSASINCSLEPTIVLEPLVPVLALPFEPLVALMAEAFSLSPKLLSPYQARKHVDIQCNLMCVECECQNRVVL